LPDGPAVPQPRRSPHRIKNLRTEKKMLLSVSLLSSIVGQWLRAAGSLQRRVRY
jgi:hypothetical protein